MNLDELFDMKAVKQYMERPMLLERDVEKILQAAHDRVK